MRKSSSKKGTKTKRGKAGINSPSLLPSAVVKSLKVKLERIVLRNIEYSELPNAGIPKAIPSGTAVNIGVKMEGRLTLYAEGVELLLRATVTPDPQYKPVKVIAGISGFFRRHETTSDEDLFNFAKSGGVRIVFPYLREIVSNISMRGVYGPVWLNPLSVTILTDDSAPWEKRG